LRLRLTAIYGGLFLLSGAILLTLVYVLLSRDFGGPFATFSFSGINASVIHGLHPAGFTTVVSGRETRIEAVELATAELRLLLIWSCVGLGAMTVVSIGAGWMVAGRVLSPIRTITATAREISARNLHRRLALTGPDDELKELGDTFDDLIRRLDASFQSQRRFVANASHELRTPLTRAQTLLEVALADPNADLDSLRAACERAVAAGRQQERLLEALLALASSERGLGEVDAVDLVAIASEVLTSWRPEAARRDLEMSVRLSPAQVWGDARLLERLLANLVSNAIQHNVTGGQVEIETSTKPSGVRLTVINTGPVVPEDEVPRLLQPFQRLEPARDARGEGSGLGLSIVQAIAAAHGAALSVRARPDGGLDVTVSFPGPVRESDAAPPRPRP
jgi:signal transduction histidine kinase